MKKIKYSVFFLTVFLTAVILTYLMVFSIPNIAQLEVSQGNSQKDALQCYENQQAKFLDKNGKINVLVWNVFKQSKPNWRESLKQYSQNVSLALLQEVSMTEEFKAYSEQSTWFSSHVEAFSVFGLSTGVLTLSTTSPLLACAHIELEPWIQLPKSGIYAIFQLSDGRELVVVNLHSVNFTYGVEEYEKQISVLVSTLKKHQGPIVFAGDLNAWSLERLTTIEKTLNQLGLVEVEFSPDNRKRFINSMALDYVFYRELELVNAMSPITDASDHNPLLVEFRL